MKKIQCAFVYRIIFMLLALAVFTVIGAGTARAQSIQLNSETTEKVVSGLINGASSIISDTYTPMTHFSEDDWTTSIVPVYYRITRVYDSPELRGDGLKGWAFALGGGVALSGNLMAYCILSGINFKGGVNAKGINAIDSEIEYSLYSLYPGIGYDIIRSNNEWSIPLYIGAGLQRYKTDITSRVPQLLSASNYQNIDATGEGFIYNGTFSIAVSRNLLGLFRITPYYLYSRSVNKPGMKINSYIDVTFPVAYTAPVEFKIKLDNINASMLGFNFAYLPDDSLSISFCLGGLLSSVSALNDTLANGLEMATVVVAVTYTSNFSKDPAE